MHTRRWIIIGLAMVACRPKSMGSTIKVQVPVPSPPDGGHAPPAGPRALYPAPTTTVQIPVDQPVVHGMKVGGSVR